MTWDQMIQVAPALLSAVAAIAAAVATWRGPLAAAKLAESLRRTAEASTDRRRYKLGVFAQVMQERAELYTLEGVRALNSIDIAFADSVRVREAWAELFQTFDPRRSTPAHVTDEKTRKLLQEMATDLGLSDQLRLDDFARVYFPTALQKERQVQALQRELALKQLLGQSSPAANAAEPAPSLWPPKPE